MIKSHKTIHFSGMCGASILWRIPCCGHSAHGWLPRHHQFPFFRPSKSTQFCSGRPLFSLLWSSPAVLMQLNPPAASQVVQWQRVHLPVQGIKRHRFKPWVRSFPWTKKWLPTPVFLTGKSHGQRNLAGYSPWCHKESRTRLSTRAHTPPHTHTHQLSTNNL